MTLPIYNIDGYVADPLVNELLGIDLSSVKDEPGGAVTLKSDQLWMTGVGKLAHKPLSAFEGVVDPRNWDDCSATKSFFVEMAEVNPHAGWPKLIDETVRLKPGSAHPNMTARLNFDYEMSTTVVKCSFDLDHEGEIVVDRGSLKATKVRARLPDVFGPGEVTFFRFTSSKTIKFADGRLLPDPILAMFWGWAATKHVDCVD